MPDDTREVGEKRIEYADFSRARLHSPNFEGAHITDAWLRDADVSGDIGGMRLNGVEVAPLVEAELDRRYPERVLLRATDALDLREAWTLVEGKWRATVERALALPRALLDERVDGEWSFIETLRHLVMATDCWLGRMVRHEARPWHPLGIAYSGGRNPAAPEPPPRPTLDEVLEVRADRTSRVRDSLATMTDAELDRVCAPPDTREHPREPRTVRECVHVILNEEWEHNLYASRDLAELERRSSTS